MRAIDADALKERIKRFLGIKSLDDLLPAERAIVQHIDRMPTIRTEQRWIPVTERLPENGEQVLVYARNVHYALAKYDEMREAGGTYKKQWVTFDAWKPFYTIKEVIAWMPLPKREGDAE